MWGKREEGYALPSMLFLVTLLTLVAFSVLLLDYLDRQMALRQVARVKAEYAAQSGVARMLEPDPSQQGSLEPFAERRFSFEDGSEASVRVQPWGLYHLAESRGVFRTSSELRLALLAEEPPDAFKQALVLGGNQHQLVFTGSSRITGDITIGPSGATTGSLHGYSTPATLPLQGHITSGTPSNQMPQVDRGALRRVRQYYDRLLAHEGPPLARTITLASGEAIGSVADSIDLAYATGSVHLEEDSLFHRTRPLVVVMASQGTFSVAPGTRVRGPLSIVSEDSIFVGKGASLSHCVLYSAKAITVEDGRLLSVQLLAPRISIERATVASYPSALVSIAPGGALPLRQKIHMKEGSSLEGFIFLDSPFGDDLVIVEPQATVTGAIYSTARVTLDGTVEGSVLAGDFYFYEPPTMYLGWLRSGVIDRPALSEGFLVPPVFLGNRSHDILEWL